MRTLVTGAAGFIGTSLCERLSQTDHTVLGLDRHTPREAIPDVDYRLIDLTSPDQIRDIVRAFAPDVVYHMAAQSRVDPSLVDPEGTFRDNVSATLNVAGALRTHAPEARLVFASSEAVYGPATRYPTPETEPLRPQSPYAASKAAAEHVVRSVLPERHLIVRSGMGFGLRSDPNQQVVARFLTRAIGGKGLRFPAHAPAEGHPTRDINYVGNFLDGITTAVEAQANGTYNIATGIETSVLDLAHLVVKTVGRGSVELDPSYSYRVGEPGCRICLDITKARTDFGYEPRTRLAAGLEITRDWLLAEASPAERTLSVRIDAPALPVAP